MGDSSQQKFVIGVDVGGTNTDSVLVDITTHGIVSRMKQLTTADVVSGVRNSINELVRNISPNFQLSSVVAVVIGTTHFVNAILQKGEATAAEKLSRVSVVRLCGTTSLDFPPFCSIDNQDLLARIQGPSYLISGGFQFDAVREYMPINANEITTVAQRIIASDVHNIVISGLFSIQNASQELAVRDQLLQYFTEAKYPISITLSSAVSRKEGIIERENAAIINESIKFLASSTFASFTESLQSLGFPPTTPLFISHNDGSLMDIKTASQTPLFTFSASIINSLKGGAAIYNESTGIVADIGGTSTDFAVMSKGIPRTSSKYIDINGIPLNFRMPLVQSIPLGGGSIVEVTRIGSSQTSTTSESKLNGDNSTTQTIQVRILKDSLGYRITQAGVCFESGTTLCNTDFAIYKNSACNERFAIPGSDKNRFIEYFTNRGFSLEEIEEIVKLHSIELAKKLSNELENFIVDSKSVSKVLLVGGGASLFDIPLLRELSGAQVDVLDLVSDLGVANALGATLSDVTHSSEKIISASSAEKENEEIARIQADLFAYIEAQGANKPIELVEVITNKAAYQEDLHSKKIYLKAKGKFSWENVQQLLSTIASTSAESIEYPIIPPSTSTFNYPAAAALSQSHSTTTTFYDNVNQTTDSSNNSESKTQLLIQRLVQLPQGAKSTEQSFVNGPASVDSSVAASLKPIVEIHSERDLEYLAWGAAILGSGGGGSVNKGLLLAKKIFREKQRGQANPKPYYIYDARSLTEEHFVCELANFGAPSVSLENLLTIQELDFCFNSLNEIYKKRINCVSCLEIGGQNAFTPLLLSLARDIPLVDCNTLCRAFPEYRQTLGVIQGEVGLPMVFVDSKRNKEIFDETTLPLSSPPTRQELIDFEAQLRTYAIQNHALMGDIACFAGDKAYVEANCFKDSYKLCYDIGKCLYEGVRVQQRLIEEVIDQSLPAVAPNAKVLIKGKIIESRRSTEKGYDFGEILVQQAADKLAGTPERRMLVKYKNEYLIAYEVTQNPETGLFTQSTPVVMTPDIISVVDDFKGDVIHSEDVCFGLRVIVFAMSTDARYCSELALQSVGPSAMGLGSDVDFSYKPYY